MKRNESILVYGVTGLLVLILFVAVVFGNEGEALARPDGENKVAEEELDDPALELAELMNLDPTASLEEGEEGEAGEGEEEAAGEPVAGEPGTDPEGAVPAGEEEEAKELEATLAAEVGRQGDYREVTVRRGDTLSLMVQRWTGSLDQMPMVEALNEDIQRDQLRPGRKVLMPWVDQTVLDKAAQERRLAENRREAVVETPVSEPVAGSPERVYTLKKGDSLWKIAVQVTGSQNEAPAFVKRVMELNPGLRPERLQVGQAIVLPQS